MKITGSALIDIVAVLPIRSEDKALGAQTEHLDRTQTEHLHHL